MPASEGARQQTRVSVSDALKRRELLEEFLFWYFDSFLIPLLKVREYTSIPPGIGLTLHRRHSTLQSHPRSGTECCTFDMMIGKLYVRH